MNQFESHHHGITQAVSYRRVSSKAQVARGDGLTSQDTRCKEYARYKGYTIVETFTDDISGKHAARSGMDEMLAFLRSNRKTGPYVILIDDISRLARDIRVHWDLRDAISAAGGVLESPNMTFKEDADSRHYENMQASSAEYMRQKNAEQTNSRMRARLTNGYWPFCSPIGYAYHKTKTEGAILVRDEPLASIIQEALQGYASGRFEAQAEVMRFLQSFPAFPKDKNKTVRNQRVKDILTRPIYAGYVEHKPWGITKRKGKHIGQALITLEDYEKIQRRLTEKTRAPARKDLNKDFPLRGAVVCSDCDTPLTACWSKGSKKRYPYYLCPQKGCESYGKSIRRDVLEGEFEALLKSLKPTKALFNLTCVMLKDIWDHRMASLASVTASAKKKTIELDHQIEQTLDRIVEVNNPRVIQKLEQRIDEMEREKLLLMEKAVQNRKPQRSFEETLRTALDFLGNPQKIWASERLEDKRMVLRMAFADRLAYSRKTGLRTPNLAIPFKVLGDIDTVNFRMAHPGDIEQWGPFFNQLTLNNMKVRENATCGRIHSDQAPRGHKTTGHDFLSCKINEGRPDQKATDEGMQDDH